MQYCEILVFFCDLFFLTFIALGSNYTPTDELLEKEDENGGGMKMEKLESKSAEECRSLIQNRLDDWCAHLGYSSRTYLYRIFKAKEGCAPTEWRVEQAEKCK